MEKPYKNTRISLLSHLKEIERKAIRSRVEYETSYSHLQANDTVENSLLIDNLHNDYRKKMEELQKESAETLWLLQLKEIEQEKRKRLTFQELFKSEHVPKIDFFIQALEKNGFINNKNEWIKNNLSEPARIYFYLKEKGIIKTIYKDTPALKCFYKQFGITVYESNNKPKEECLCTTRENVTSQFAKDFSSNEYLYNRYFSHLFTQK
jgi:hypothetical protein